MPNVTDSRYQVACISVATAEIRDFFFQDCITLHAWSPLYNSVQLRNSLSITLCGMPSDARAKIL